MNIAIAIILGLLALLSLSLLLPLRLLISFSHTSGSTTYSLRAGLGPITISLVPILKKKAKKDVPKEEKEPQEEKKPFTFKDLEKGIQKGILSLRYLKKKLTVSVFSLRARFSLGDAADTGIATGAAYGTIYSLLGAADRYFVLKKHEVCITPVFQGIGCEAVVYTELRLRLIYGIGLINKIRKEDVK